MNIISLIKLVGDRKSEALEKASLCGSAQEFRALAEEYGLHLNASDARELLLLAAQFGFSIDQEAASEYICMLENKEYGDTPK